MNRSKLAAALALITLAGCAASQQGVGTAPMSTRTVVVNVANGVITVPEDPASLFANNGVIKWVFGSDPSGFVFPADGIKFEANPTPPPGMGCRSFPDPDTVFRNCAPRQRGTEFHCNKTGPHVVDACFKYDVKVQPVGGGAPIVLDPWIRLK